MSETIIFFGSGPVAAESLRLLSVNFSIEYVITKPKPAKHHAKFPVIDTAKDLKIPILTVSDKKELTKILTNQSFNSRLGVLVDFGIIVDQSAINAFELGIVNSHFSVLPEWRGADPISFAILSGQSSTGVSLMLLVKAMDEGPLIAYQESRIGPKSTTPTLTEKLISLSNDLLKEHLPKYLEDRSFFPQTKTGKSVSYSRKLTKEDGIIDWSKPAEQIEREIRAFIEWPKSRTVLANKDVIITSAKVISKKGAVGQIFADNKELIICAGQKALKIDRLKPAGKIEMSGESFISGHIKQLIK